MLSEKLKKEVAEKFPNASKTEKSDLDIEDVSMDALDKKKWDFSIPFLNKRKKVRVKYVSNNYTHIPAHRTSSSLSRGTTLACSISIARALKPPMAAK